MWGHTVVNYRCRHSIDQLWSLKDRISVPDDTTVRTDDDVYKSDDILNAANLVCHDDKLEKDDHLLRTFIAVFLLKLLQFNNYFGNYSDSEQFSELSEKERYVGGLLLHFLYTFPQNVHDIAILHTQDMTKFLASSEIKSLGAGGIQNNKNKNY